MQHRKPVAHTPNSSRKWHDLQEHLEGVADKAKVYAEKFGAGELGYYAGLWHDLGKYNPDFQSYLDQCALAPIDTTGLRSVPHAIYGARLAWEVLMPLAPIIYGHHRGLPEKQCMRSKLMDSELDESYHEVMHQARQHLSQLQPTTDPYELMGNLVNLGSCFLTLSNFSTDIVE